MSRPETTSRPSASAKVSDSGYPGDRLPEIVLSPPGNRHRGRDIRDDRTGVRSSGLDYIDGADRRRRRRRASVSPTNTRHPYTLPPIESFASREDGPSSRSSQRAQKRSRSRTSHMDGLGEWRPEGGFYGFREPSSTHLPGGSAYYNMPGSTRERDSHPQTWNLPASTSYPSFNQPGPPLSNQPYREYHSPTSSSIPHPPTFPTQPGFPHPDHIHNPRTGSHVQSGYTIGRDERLPGSVVEVKRTRGNSDPTSDNSGIVETPWALTTDRTIDVRPYTHRPNPTRFDLARQSGPLSSPILSTGFETIGDSRPGSRQDRVMPPRKPRSSFPTLSVPSTGGTWNRSSTPNLPSYGRMLPGGQYEPTSREPLGTASGSTGDKQLEARPTSSEDRNRPRKRTRTGTDFAGAGKENINRNISNRDVRDRISTYCDELCDLAEGSAQGESSANVHRLSDLSKQIVLQLSALASEAGLKDLVVTEEDLANGLEPLAIGDTSMVRSRTEISRAKTDMDSYPAVLPIGKSVAKPTSVMNFQTPQEAARDMEFIRMRRDELNAKAAAAERDKEGKEQGDSEVSMQVEVGEILADDGLASDTLGQDSITTNLPDYQQAGLTSNPFASPPALLPAAQTISMDNTFMPPLQRHPFRFSTYQPFMPFPYVMNEDQGSLGAYNQHMEPNSMAFPNMPFPSSPTRSCHSCGVMQASEWKTGPDGPETLCAVCGYHWLQQGQAWASLPGYKVSFQVGEAL